MQSHKLTVCSLMAALVIALETAVVLGGEALVFITILSAIPMYIAVRTSTEYGILGYISVAFLLFFISPHQAMFFACTNGLVGTSLGICRKGGLNRLITCGIGATLLLAGLGIVGLLLGVMRNFLSCPLLVAACVLLCAVYTLICDHVLEKINRLIQSKNKSTKGE